MREQEFQGGPSQGRRHRRSQPRSAPKARRAAARKGRKPGTAPQRSSESRAPRKQLFSAFFSFFSIFGFFQLFSAFSSCFQRFPAFFSFFHLCSDFETLKKHARYLSLHVPPPFRDRKVVVFPEQKRHSPFIIFALLKQLFFVCSENACFSSSHFS